MPIFDIFGREWTPSDGTLVTRTWFKDKKEFFAELGKAKADGASWSDAPGPATKRAGAGAEAQRPGPQPKTVPDFIAARLAVCRACPHYRAGPPERCGELVRRGKAGLLVHPRGLPDPRARCPDGRWAEDGPE